MKTSKMGAITHYLRSKVATKSTWLRFRLSKNAVLVLGDSHASVFNHPYLQQKLKDIYFHVCIVGGATISSLENPNSKTNSKIIFEIALKTYRHRKITIVMLGEVDTGFVIWYRAAKYKESVDKMLKKTIVKYRRFIKNIKKNGEILVISTPLPTINDNSSGDVANLRREVTSTLAERTKLTVEFNSAMHVFCATQHVPFISLDDESMGNDGLVNPVLLNHDPTDHHYDQLSYAKLLVPKLRSLLQ